MEDVYRVSAVGAKVCRGLRRLRRPPRTGVLMPRVECCAGLEAHVKLGINNMFEVVTANRTYHLIADSEREMLQWIDILMCVAATERT